MNRKWTSLVFIIFVTSPLLAARNATVIQNGVALYQDQDSSTVQANLDYGTPIRIQKQKGSRYFVSTTDLKGWISQSKVSLASDRFSNVENAAILSPRIIQENGQAYLYFYTRETVVKYDIYQRRKLSAYKSGMINNIHAYGTGNRLLVEGIYTNGTTTHNLRILHLENGHYTDISSYQSKQAVFLGGEFSEDGKYIALQFQVGGKSQIAVFLSENGEYVGTARDASQFFWYDHKLILQDGNSLWILDLSTTHGSDLSYHQDRMLVKLNSSQIPRDGLDSAFSRGVIYYETKQGIKAMDVNQKQAVNTRLKSLEFDTGMILNHTLNNDSHRLYLMSSGSTYSYFQGSKPRYEFVQFLDKHIIYTRVVEKLETLFLAPVSDPYDKTAYKYRAIDEIDAWSDDGILAEISHDKDMSAIIVEVPSQKTFFVILLKQ